MAGVLLLCALGVVWLIALPWVLGANEGRERQPPFDCLIDFPDVTTSLTVTEHMEQLVAEHNARVTSQKEQEQ